MAGTFFLDAASRPFFHLHIRKAAGSSVRNWLRNRFAARDCFLDCHYAANERVNPGEFRFVTGHVNYKYVDRFPVRPITFVVLREPVERAFSAYSFFRANDEQYLCKLLETLPRRDAENRIRFTRRAGELPLLEFLEREPDLARSLLANVQTRNLLSSPLEGDPDSRDLVEAIRNLESCELVGLTDRLDESLAKVAAFMGWRFDDTIPHDNTGASRYGLDAIPPRARDILTEWNRLDLELYRAAEQLFATRVVTQRALPLALPACADFTFDLPIHGRGWYPRERDDRGWFSWMGSEATLELAPAGRGPQLFEAHVAHVLQPNVLGCLEVRVNGQLLATRVRAGSPDRIVEVIVPAGVLEVDRDRMSITFKVPRPLRPCDLAPGNPDRRLLGVALQRVRMLSSNSTA